MVTHRHVCGFRVPPHFVFHFLHLFFVWSTLACKLISNNLKSGLDSKKVLTNCQEVNKTETVIFMRKSTETDRSWLTPNRNSSSILIGLSYVRPMYCTDVPTWELERGGEPPIICMPSTPVWPIYHCLIDVCIAIHNHAIEWPN